MFNKYVVPALAVAGITATIVTVRSQSAPVVEVTTTAAVEPVRSPFARTVSGSGLVEAASENIAVAPPVGGVVTEVAIEPGDVVKRGDLLFRLDDREMAAERASRESDLASARLDLERLKSLPRPEDVPIAEAELRAAEADFDRLSADARRAAELLPSGAIGEQVEENARLAAQAAKARVQLVAAELEKLRRGAWEPELAVAQAAVDAAQARLDAVNVELDRLVVRAPIDGHVLSTSIRTGQFAPAGITDPPLVLLGETNTLRLRVDVDENDAWRVQPGARAQAFLRGNPAINAEVDFLRIEPAVVPKRSLTGSNSERTDTRVLQVLFTVPRDRFPAYVGQLVDVRMEDKTAAPKESKP